MIAPILATNGVKTFTFYGKTPCNVGGEISGWLLHMREDQRKYILVQGMHFQQVNNSESAEEWQVNIWYAESAMDVDVIPSQETH